MDFNAFNPIQRLIKTDKSCLQIYIFKILTFSDIAFFVNSYKVPVILDLKIKDELFS